MMSFHPAGIGTRFGGSRAGASHASPPVTHVMVGGVRHDRFVVSAKLSAAATLRVGSGSYPLSPDANGMAKVEVSGLAPDTEYGAAWEVGGLRVAGDQVGGRVRTAPEPERPHSFSFAFASCSDSGSNSQVFSEIRRKAPAFFIHMGDMHYENLSSSSGSVYRTAYEACMARPEQHRFYSHVPTSYVYDDHDFAGGNESDSTRVGATVVPVVYRQMFPHYPLVDSGSSEGVYHTFEWGRARFIVLDMRRYRSPDANTDNSSKTILGSAQKTWLKNLLLPEPSRPKFLVSPAAWTQNENDSGDNWGSYKTERTELVNFFAANGIRNMVILAGDSHLLAADDGRNSPGGIPVFQAAPLDHNSNHTSLATYQLGPSPSSDGLRREQYGWIEVTDDGSTMTVRFEGRNQSGATVIGPLAVRLTQS